MLTIDIDKRLNAKQVLIKLEEILELDNHTKDEAATRQLTQNFDNLSEHEKQKTINRQQLRKILEYDVKNQNSDDQLGGTNFEDLINQGLHLEDLKKYDEALKFYEKAIIINPFSAIPFFNLGCLLDNLMNYEDSIQFYDKAIILNKNFKEAHNNKGVALFNLSEFKKSINSFNNAIRIEENYCEAHFNKDKFQIIQKVWPYLSQNIILKQQFVMIKLYKQIMLTQKYSIIKVEYKQIIGVALQNLLKLKEALQCYNQALQIEPNNQLAQQNKCKIKVKLEQIQKIIK